MSDSVIRLVDRAPAPVDGTKGLVEWLRNWADVLEEGRYGEVASLVLVIESKDGRIAKIAQSTRTLDKARLIGLMQLAMHYDIDNNAAIESLEEP